MDDLAKELRRLRKLSGFSQAKLARAVGFVPSAVANWETSRNMPALDAVRTLDQILESRGSLESLWREATATNGLPPWLKNDGELLKRAQSVDIVSPVLVPGFLQSPQYARFVLTEARPRDSLARIDALVKARTSMLPEKVRVSAIFADSALQCVASEVRREQVEHLLNLQAEGRCQVYLVPGTLVPVASAFQVYRLHDGTEVATADHLRGAVAFDADVDWFREVQRAALGYASPTRESWERLKGMASDV